MVFRSRFLLFLLLMLIELACGKPSGKFFPFTSIKTNVSPSNQKISNSDYLSQRKENARTLLPPNITLTNSTPPFLQNSGTSVEYRQTSPISFFSQSPLKLNSMTESSVRAQLQTHGDSELKNNLFPKEQSAFQFYFESPSVSSVNTIKPDTLLSQNFNSLILKNAVTSLEKSQTPVSALNENTVNKNCQPIVSKQPCFKGKSVASFDTMKPKVIQSENSYCNMRKTNNDIFTQQQKERSKSLNRLENSISLSDLAQLLNKDNSNIDTKDQQLTKMGVLAQQQINPTSIQNSQVQSSMPPSTLAQLLNRCYSNKDQQPIMSNIDFLPPKLNDWGQTIKYSNTSESILRQKGQPSQNINTATSNNKIMQLQSISQLSSKIGPLKFYKAQARGNISPEKTKIQNINLQGNGSIGNQVSIYPASKTNKELSIQYLPSSLLDIELINKNEKHKISAHEISEKKKTQFIENQYESPNENLQQIDKLIILPNMPLFQSNSESFIDNSNQVVNLSGNKVKQQISFYDLNKPPPQKSFTINGNHTFMWSGNSGSMTLTPISLCQKSSSNSNGHLNFISGSATNADHDLLPKIVPNSAQLPQKFQFNFLSSNNNTFSETASIVKKPDESSAVALSNDCNTFTLKKHVQSQYGSSIANKFSPCILDGVVPPQNKLIQIPSIVKIPDGLTKYLLSNQTASSSFSIAPHNHLNLPIDWNKQYKVSLLPEVFPQQELNIYPTCDFNSNMFIKSPDTLSNFCPSAKRYNFPVESSSIVNNSPSPLVTFITNSPEYRPNTLRNINTISKLPFVNFYPSTEPPVAIALSNVCPSRLITPPATAPTISSPTNKLLTYVSLPHLQLPTVSPLRSPVSQLPTVIPAKPCSGRDNSLPLTDITSVHSGAANVAKQFFSSIIPDIPDLSCPGLSLPEKLIPYNTGSLSSLTSSLPCSSYNLPPVLIKSCTVENIPKYNNFIPFQKMSGYYNPSQHQPPIIPLNTILNSPLLTSTSCMNSPTDSFSFIPLSSVLNNVQNTQKYPLISVKNNAIENLLYSSVLDNLIGKNGNVNWDSVNRLMSLIDSISI